MACSRKATKDLLFGPLCTGKETLASGRGFESLSVFGQHTPGRREREGHWLTLAHGMQQEGYEGSTIWAIVHRKGGLETQVPMASGRGFESLGNTHLVEESHWLTLANTGTWHAAGRLRRI
jgi:hypothetical protein